MKFERLIKVLTLTSSPEDFEALAAIRQANRMLSEHKLTWRELLRHEPPTRASGSSHQQQKPNFYQPSQPDEVASIRRDEIEEMFSFLHAIDEELTESTQSFVESLYGQFQYKRTLTPKQYVALKRIFESHGGSL